jgi:Lar family restriction alleviation protein
MEQQPSYMKSLIMPIGPDPLPCPFCGHNRLAIINAHGSRYAAAECMECGARGPEIHQSTKDIYSSVKIIESWNTRGKKTDGNT